MKKIEVEIYWVDKNFSCGWSYENFGAILCTNKSLDGLKSEFIDALHNQIADMVADGEELPRWLINGEFEVEFSMAVSALLRQAESFTTMAAISRYTGINQKLLSHYANSLKIPRSAQRERIIEGLHKIGRQALSIQ